MGGLDDFDRAVRSSSGRCLRRESRRLARGPPRLPKVVRCDKAGHAAGVIAPRQMQSRTQVRRFKQRRQPRKGSPGGSLQHILHGAQENLDVAPQRPGGNVGVVELDLLLERHAGRVG